MGVKRIRRAAQDLRDALKREKEEAIREAQRRFSEAVEAAWQMYQQGRIEVEVRGLPRVMYLWAMEDLPRQIEDRSNWPQIIRELEQFLRTMDHVVEPRETV